MTQSIDKTTSPQPAKLREIMGLTGLSKSSVYRLSSNTDSTFPSPIKMSERSSVWDRQKVVDYVNERFALAEEGDD
jgi:predicted DNA-binding transcriptional regulator AlpA